MCLECVWGVLGVHLGVFGVCLGVFGVSLGYINTFIVFLYDQLSL